MAPRMGDIDMTRTLAAAAVAALLCACGSDSPKLGSAVNCKAGGSTLGGSFMAPNGTTPVVGGNVVISTAPGCQAVTDKAGAFTFQNVPSSAATVTATKGFLTATASGTPGQPLTLQASAAGLRLAYVPGSYDQIEAVLTRLGFGSSLTALTADQLGTAALDQYHAVFLDCGLDDTWATDAGTQAKLRAYVGGGGYLYASDWAYTYVDGAYPGKIVFLAPDPRVGQAADAVKATIHDASLEAALGKATASINFNLGSWVVIDSVPAPGQVLVSGPVTTYDAAFPDKPFVARFADGTGRVTYTSFHNEAQTTADMDLLLEQMLLGL